MAQTDDFMTLELKALPYKEIPGIYGKKGDRFARRLSFLHPEAARSFVELESAVEWKIVLSDMWRSSLASLRRKFPEDAPARKGTARPSYSGHNYGFSVDLDVGRTLRALKLKTKSSLDRIMETGNFYCHRRDGRRQSEEWHYNWLARGKGPRRWLERANSYSTRGALDAMIEDAYGGSWDMTRQQVQRSLAYLKIYDGEIDGKIGPLSKAAIRVFQRAWFLASDGIAGPMTRRTLAFRCSELQCGLVNEFWSVKG